MIVDPALDASAAAETRAKQAEIDRMTLRAQAHRLLAGLQRMPVPIKGSALVRMASAVAKAAQVLSTVHGWARPVPPVAAGQRGATAMSEPRVVSTPGPEPGAQEPKAA